MTAEVADVNWVGSEGDTPLLAACRNGHTPTALCLLHHGADVNTAALTDGQTALHLSCRKGNEAVAEALIQKGANFLAVDHRGEGFCLVAVQKRTRDVVLCLLYTKLPMLFRIR